MVFSRSRCYFHDTKILGVHGHAGNMATLLPAEIKFAQNLAANDKKIRFRAVKKLRKYLRAKSSSKKGKTCNELRVTCFFPESIRSKTTRSTHGFHNVTVECLVVCQSAYVKLNLTHIV